MNNTKNTVETNAEKVVLESEEAKNTEKSTPIFREYEDKKAVAEKILVELNERFITITENGKERKGFRMDDTSDQIGLLSQCQSLQTLVSLAQDFGLSFTKKNIIPNQKGTIRQMMDIIIEDV